MAEKATTANDNNDYLVSVCLRENEVIPDAVQKDDRTEVVTLTPVPETSQAFTVDQSMHGLVVMSTAEEETGNLDLPVVLKLNVTYDEESLLPRPAAVDIIEGNIQISILDKGGTWVGIWLYTLERDLFVLQNKMDDHIILDTSDLGLIFMILITDVGLQNNNHKLILTLLCVLDITGCSHALVLGTCEELLDRLCFNPGIATSHGYNILELLYLMVLQDARKASCTRPSSSLLTSEASLASHLSYLLIFDPGILLIMACQMSRACTTSLLLSRVVRINGCNRAPRTHMICNAQCIGQLKYQGSIVHAQCHWKDSYDLQCSVYRAAEVPRFSSASTRSLEGYSRLHKDDHNQCKLPAEAVRSGEDTFILSSNSGDVDSLVVPIIGSSDNNLCRPLHTELFSLGNVQQEESMYQNRVRLHDAFKEQAAIKLSLLGEHVPMICSMQSRELFVLTRSKKSGSVASNDDTKCFDPGILYKHDSGIDLYLGVVFKFTDVAVQLCTHFAENATGDFLLSAPHQVYTAQAYVHTRGYSKVRVSANQVLWHCEFSWLLSISHEHHFRLLVPAGQLSFDLGILRIRNTGLCSAKSTYSSFCSNTASQTGHCGVGHIVIITEIQHEKEGACDSFNILSVMHNIAGNAHPSGRPVLFLLALVLILDKPVYGHLLSGKTVGSNDGIVISNFSPFPNDSLLLGQNYVIVNFSIQGEQWDYHSVLFMVQSAEHMESFSWHIAWSATMARLSPSYGHTCHLSRGICGLPSGVSIQWMVLQDSFSIALVDCTNGHPVSVLPALHILLHEVFNIGAVFGHTMIHSQGTVTYASILPSDGMYLLGFRIPIVFYSSRGYGRMADHFRGSRSDIPVYSAIIFYHLHLGILKGIQKCTSDIITSKYILQSCTHISEWPSAIFVWQRRAKYGMIDHTNHLFSKSWYHFFPYTSYGETWGKTGILAAKSQPILLLLASHGLIMLPQLSEENMESISAKTPSCSTCTFARTTILEGPSAITALNSSGICQTWQCSLFLVLPYHGPSCFQSGSTATAYWWLFSRHFGISLGSPRDGYFLLWGWLVESEQSITRYNGLQMGYLILSNVSYNAESDTVYGQQLASVLASTTLIQNTHQLWIVHCQVQTITVSKSFVL